MLQDGDQNGDGLIDAMELRLLIERNGERMRARWAGPATARTTPGRATNPKPTASGAIAGQTATNSLITVTYVATSCEANVQSRHEHRHDNHPLPCAIATARGNRVAVFDVRL